MAFLTNATASGEATIINVDAIEKITISSTSYLFTMTGGSTITMTQAEYKAWLIAYPMLPRIPFFGEDLKDPALSFAPMRSIGDPQT